MKNKPQKNTDNTPEGGLHKAPCWADLTTTQRNNLVGNIIDGNVIRRPYMARDGKYLWYCPITAEEAGERGKWLLEQQATEESWKRFRKDFDKRITAEDRGKITIEIEEHHLRYSDTPGGGWMVIEAIRKAGYAIQIGHDASNWIVSTGRNGEPVGMSATTMEEAACMLALLILPNAEADATRPL